jgi:hypothetical protein
MFDSTLLPRTLFVLMGLSLLAGSAVAGAPAGVADLEWCFGTQTCLTWSASVGATGYEVYRGAARDLPALLDDSIDSCTVDVFTDTATGEILAETPAPAMLHWYLVRAHDGQEAGDAGSATAGPRIVDSSGACAVNGALVINELDYDQPGIDSGEFIELFNPGPSARSLAGLALILVNGTNGAEYSRVDLGQAGPSLAAGGYLVVGTAVAVAATPQGTLTIELASSSNNAQNGAPDGVALVDTVQAILIDAVSYEGSISAAQLDGIPGTFDLVEGTATTAADSGTLTGALVRLPNGVDTDDAQSDWAFSETPTPGMPNLP